MAKQKAVPVEENETLLSEGPKIRARIISSDDGLQFLPQVSAVRIRSANHGLLIMEDYLPTLGSIDGSVVFLTPEEEVRFDHISGFYKHQHNEFTLLIQGVHKVEPQAEPPQEKSLSKKEQRKQEKQRKKEKKNAAKEETP